MSDTETDGEVHTIDRVRRSTARTVGLLLSVAAVLGVGAGLALLTYRGQVGPSALVLYAGVVLGYLLRSFQDLT